MSHVPGPRDRCPLTRDPAPATVTGSAPRRRRATGAAVTPEVAVLPVLLVVISFVLGLRKERPRAVLLSALVALTGIALVVVMSFVEETDFFDTASGYLQLVAGFVACLVAAVIGGAVRDRRARAAV